MISRRKQLASVSLLLAMVACGEGKKQNSFTQSVSDVESMEQRSDGRYDVTCSAGYYEVVTAEEVQMNQVCPSRPAEPTSGSYIARGEDRQLEISHDVSNTFGKGLWEGYMSFTLETGTSSYTEIRDALGGVWKPSRDKKIVFSRLDLPVVIDVDGFAPSGTYGHVKISNITYEITKVNPITGNEFQGLMTGLNGSSRQVGSIATDIPGVKVSFLAKLSLFDNFTNGTSCGRVRIKDRDQKEVFLDSEHSVLNIDSMIAPLSISAYPTCESTRLANPESSDRDFHLTIPKIQIGDPV